jgi:hypothetical protein
MKGDRMSGKMGKKSTGRKPDAARRQSAKTDGAFGKETVGQVNPGDANRNQDKAVRKVETARGSGA